MRIDNPYRLQRLPIRIHSIHRKEKNKRRGTTELTVAHDGNSETMADTNDEHTRINEDEPQFDEDPPWIEEMKMREFERRNELSVNE